MLLTWHFQHDGKRFVEKDLFDCSGTGSNERVLALEQKIFKLQEELTVLHRTKGEVNTERNDNNYLNIFSYHLKLDSHLPSETKRSTGNRLFK